MKRYAFIILLCVAVSFVMASCGDEVILDNEEMCIYSGGTWDGTCNCGDKACTAGVFCIGKENNKKCASDNGESR